MNGRVREIVRGVVEHEHDIKKAVAKAVKSIQADPELVRETLSELVTDVVQHLVYAIRHSDKLDGKRALLGECRTRDDGQIDAIGNIWRESILSSWLMPDGRTLGEWNGKELGEQAAAESELAGGHLRNARFYGKLAHIAGEKPLAKATSNKRVRELWQSISAAEEKSEAA